MRFSVSLSWMTWGIWSKYSTAASCCVFALFPLILRLCSINVKPTHSIRRWLGCCLCHVKLSHSCCWFCKQILALVSSSNKDWWSVRNSKGKEGFVPANYVKETNPQVVQKPVKKMQKVTKTIKVNKKMSAVNCACDMTTYLVLCLYVPLCCVHASTQAIVQASVHICVSSQCSFARPLDFCLGCDLAFQPQVKKKRMEKQKAPQRKSSLSTSGSLQTSSQRRSGSLSTFAGTGAAVMAGRRVGALSPRRACKKLSFKVCGSSAFYVCMSLVGHSYHISRPSSVGLMQ